MKSIQIVLSIALLTLVALPSHGQLNKKVNTKQVSGSKLKGFQGPVAIKKIPESSFKNKLAKDLKKSKVTEMRVPASYLKKARQKSWRITPARAFGSGNLGFTLSSGALRRENFILHKDFIGNHPIAFVGRISFDAKRDKNYLIRVVTGEPNDGSYINTGTSSGTLRIPLQSGAYPILVRATETGKMTLAISAKHEAGGSESNPKPLLIKEIRIDEL